MIELILIFLYVGLFTIGGGMVAIPLIEQQVVLRGLISYEQFYSMIAVAESTPGPIGINVATYVGFNLYGVPGAILTSIAFILPSFLIVSFVYIFLKKHKDNLFVIYILYYTKVVVIGLIFYSAFNLLIKSLDINISDGFVFDLKSLALLVVLIPIYYYLRKKPIFVIFIGAILGIIVYGL